MLRVRDWFLQLGPRGKVIVIVLALVVVFGGGHDLLGSDQPSVNKPESKRQGTPAQKASQVKQKSETKPKSRCIQASAEVRSTIASSLAATRAITSIAVVKSEEEIDDKPFEGDVYIIAADITPSPGVSVWAADESVIKSGGGFIIGLDPAARAVSELGAAMPISAVGLNTNFEGVDAARKCL